MMLAKFWKFELYLHPALSRSPPLSPPRLYQRGVTLSLLHSPSLPLLPTFSLLPTELFSLYASLPPSLPPGLLRRGSRSSNHGSVTWSLHLAFQISYRAFAECLFVIARDTRIVGAMRSHLI
ncbi:hypothetical protein NL676_033995 [Syzygium grande]|nr:hypothetical protein NL676_033995 [Syzygium grande]